MLPSHITRAVVISALLSGATVCAGQKNEIPPLYQRVVVVATAPEPGAGQRSAEVFTRTLFSRDDQLFHLLEGGISAGQHEGGGKSLEIRRFGFNLDHGGVNGGLKVLVDNVQQNQPTHGHGQGYLESLKRLSPELIREVNIISGPFSAEYGDFSGLGVVHIVQRESLPDRLTLRLQGGSFGAARAFAAVSNRQGFVAYDGSRTDGPFLRPLGYVRHSVTGNYKRRLSPRATFGARMNAGAHRYDSSGQLPLDEVTAGGLDRFGFVSQGDGGRSQSGTVAGYFRREEPSGVQWKLDGFVARSLFDLYSNFTFFLNDPIRGDGIQQHDSRLQEGANAQYVRPHGRARATALFTAGGNFHENQINVGLARLGAVAASHVRVTNAGGYAQDTVSLLGGRLRAGTGLRYDAFRFDVTRAETAAPQRSAAVAARFQPKANVALTPSRRVPITLYANYGRGISTADARAVMQYSDDVRVATTDFYQAGAMWHSGRLSLTADGFWIDRSNELVYVPDDGSLEFQGPTRAYGVEARADLQILRWLRLSGGVTRVSNAFYLATAPRLYVERAPHLVANGGLTVAAWRGWSGSLRVRAINHYRLDAANPAILAAGHTVLDFAVTRPIRRGVEFSLSVDNVTNRRYWETQNWLESRLPGQVPAWRIHGTPGYPVTVTAGVTFRFE